MITFALPPASSRAQPVAADAELDKTTVTAKGRDRALLTVKSFGRYTILAKSKPGVAVQLWDTINGPGDIAGKPGESDGRADLFLDRGKYRVVTHGASKAKGTAKLEIHPYKELNGPKPPQIVELKPIDTVLGDFEQRSYWIDIPARRNVVFEAAGRNLTDLRLWKDGTWIVDVAPSLSDIEPTVGRPLRVARLFVDLEPGLYLLSAYGGAPKAWAEDDGRHPFHLRFGIPSLPTASRKRYSVGPFGYDRYWVPSANYFRLELPEARPAQIDVRQYSGGANPFTAGTEAGGAIDKKTNPPVAELNLGSYYASNVQRLVTISAPHGQPYLLQHFVAERYHVIPATGTYWISTIHAGHPEDNCDASGILSSSNQPNVAFAAQAVELDSDHGWARRFNLLETATVYFEVKESGNYNLAATGVKAGFRMEPFMITRPPNYKTPPLENSGKTWSLDKGFWILTMEPQEKGILEIALARVGFFGSKATIKAGQAKLPRGGLVFNEMALRGSDSHTLYFSRQPGVEVGAIVRSLPMDLRDALFVTQAPGENIAVRFKTPELGTLSAEAEDGQFMDLSLDNGPWVKSAKVSPGEHSVAIRHSGAHLALYSLGLVPARWERDLALPPLPDPRLASIPDLPVLSDGKPAFLDLDRTSNAHFMVRAASPALYRLESTGLLATEGALRTRIITSFAKAQEDGIGRNFLLQQYLGTGDYQLRVGTRGATKGHLGVVLGATPMADGGALELGIPARATLPSGTAITYPFEITKEGQYQIRAIGVDRTLRCRIEDAEGWPLMKPGGKAEVTRNFEVGKYRLIVLPEPIELRVMAILEPTTKAPSFKGKGPHHLPLDTKVNHRFLEAKAGEKQNAEARRPDIWELDLPAAADVDITLTAKMQGDIILVKDGGVREKAGYIPPLRNFSGRLARGHYRLELMPLSENSDVPYALAVKPRPLMTGLSRSTNAPSRMPIAVGEDSLVELSSFGTSDVRARLLDSGGHTVLKNDDRPDDWNFHLAQRLAPGDYELVLEPVGAKKAATIITMTKRVEEAQPPLTLPAKTAVRVGQTVKVHPLQLPADAELLVVVARSPETLGLVLEAESGSTWKSLASSVGRPAHLEVPLDPRMFARKLRVRLWSADERSLPVDLRAVAIKPARISEEDLADGVTLKSVGQEIPIGAVEIALEKPGTFEIGGHEEELVRWSPGFDSAGREPVHGYFSARERRVWLVRDLSSGTASEKLKAKRVRVDPKSRLQVELDPGRSISVDVERKSGGPVLIEARAKRSQPGLAVADHAGRREMRAAAVAPGGAIGLVLDDREQPIVHVWPAEDALDPFDVGIGVKTFPNSSAATLAHGASGGTLAGGVAKRFTLPSGAKRVRFALDSGLIAALADGSVIHRLHWAAGREETIETGDNTLVLLNPGAEEARWAVEMIPVSSISAKTLALDTPYEATHPRAGSVLLDIPASPGRGKIHVRGTGASALYMGTSGRVERGEDVAIDGEGGTVLVEHGPGLVLAWIETNDGRDGLFGKATASASSVTAPASVPISGRAATFNIRADKASMIHLESAVPVVAKWTRAGVSPRIEIHPRGALVDVYVPAGQSGSLSLRPLGQELLFGTVEVTSSEVTSIGEGLGPEVMLSPGTLRVFSFEVQRSGEIGLGVRSDAPSVESILMDAAGRRIGAGVVQMHTLEKGTHLLGIRIPEGEGPVKARPALAGVSPPSTAPPEEVVKSYIQATGAAE